MPAIQPTAAAASIPPPGAERGTYAGRGYTFWRDGGAWLGVVDGDDSLAAAASREQLLGVLRSIIIGCV